MNSGFDFNKNLGNDPRNYANVPFDSRGSAQDDYRNPQHYANVPLGRRPGQQDDYRNSDKYSHIHDPFARRAAENRDAYLRNHGRSDHYNNLSDPYGIAAAREELNYFGFYDNNLPPRYNKQNTGWKPTGVFEEYSYNEPSSPPRKAPSPRYNAYNEPRYNAYNEPSSPPRKAPSPRYNAYNEPSSPPRKAPSPRYNAYNEPRYNAYNEPRYNAYNEPSSPPREASPPPSPPTEASPPPPPVPGQYYVVPTPSNFPGCPSHGKEPPKIETQAQYDQYKKEKLYRKLSLIFHPDKNPHCPPDDNMEAKFKKIKANEEEFERLNPQRGGRKKSMKNKSKKQQKYNKTNKRNK